MSVYRALADQPDLYFPTLRILSVTGEPLLRADVERFEAMTAPGARIANGYGSSEYTYVTLFFHANGDPITHDTLPLGDLLIPDDVAILDEAGNRVGAGEEGEIVVTSPLLPSGYLNDPERTAEKFKPALAFGGRRAYFTGDRARIDLQGVMHPTGRADEQMKIRGYNVIPSDIEHPLLQIPGIKQAVVVAFDGPRGIRRLACHYVTEQPNGPSAADIKAHPKGLLPGYMVPGDYMRHEALPVTPSGKVQRQKLPNPLENLEVRDRGVDAAEGEAEKAVAGIWRDILGHGDFGREDDFFDVGSDSLQAMAVLTAVERRFLIRVPLEALILDEATVAGLARRASANRTPSENGRLVAMNRGGAAAPLFALHVAGGHLSDYLELAHAFSGVRPVFGISPRGLDALVPPDSTVEAMAEHAAAVILEAAGAKPANLIGFSAVGAFAFETVRALMARGAPPPALIMLDSNCAWTDRLRWVRSAWRAAKAGDRKAGARRLVHRLLAPAALGPEPGSMDEAHLRALLDFRPVPLGLSRALLLVAEHGLAGKAEQAEWRRLLQTGLDVASTPGDHMGMLRGANTTLTAERIERWLSG